LTEYDSLVGDPNEATRRGRIGSAIDRVARQKDAEVSRLYWFTDLELAKQAAKAQGKPILSLRLLGNLDEELSCANSRFFRAVLYANSEISKILRERFVLHWSSERPAPVLTIDFGDGHQVVRTVTGNSVHYVLDSEGRPVDAIPGLYGPAAFRNVIERAEKIALQSAVLPPTERLAQLRKYHDDAGQSIRLAWDEETVKLGVRGAGLPQVPSTGPRPGAQLAMPIAVTKAAVERPLLSWLRADQLEGSLPPWEAIGRRHWQEATLDEPSRQLIRSKNPLNWNSSSPVPLSEEEFAVLLNRLQMLTAMDTVRNEYMLHSRIHLWLAANPSVDFPGLNTLIYAQLFLTPASDPWLGLIPEATFTGISNDGLLDFLLHLPLQQASR
jgi:hypothetical protein